MSALSRKKWTPETYLEFERASQERHEFVNGDVYLMTGASENHNLIVSNVITILNLQLRSRPYRVYPSDMRVQISTSYDFHYPDITVVCGQSQFAGQKRDNLLNPVVIIEVLSPSTEQYDRGRKFQNYRTLESLREYVLVAQDAQRIEHFVRQEDSQWLFSDAIGSEAVIELPSIQCRLPLNEVYDKVTFEEAEPSAPSA
jgi:Uma2 family endonuclease